MIKLISTFGYDSPNELREITESDEWSHTKNVTENSSGCTSNKSCTEHVVLTDDKNDPGAPAQLWKIIRLD